MKRVRSIQGIEMVRKRGGVMGNLWRRQDHRKMKGPEGIIDWEVLFEEKCTSRQRERAGGMEVVKVLKRKSLMGA